MARAAGTACDMGMGQSCTGMNEGHETNHTGTNVSHDVGHMRVCSLGEGHGGLNAGHGSGHVRSNAAWRGSRRHESWTLGGAIMGAVELVSTATAHGIDLEHIWLTSASVLPNSPGGGMISAKLMLNYTIVGSVSTKVGLNPIN